MKIAIIDIETAGTGSTTFKPVSPIVEVGIVELDLNTGRTEIIYDQLVRESNLVPNSAKAWIFHNSDLQFDDVMQAEPLDTDTIQYILNKYPATAFNKKFDFSFFKSRGLKINELPCPMIIATNICRIFNKTRKKYKYPSVEEAWKFFFPNELYIEEHRGADDALHEAKIVYELYKLGAFVLEDEF